MFGIMALKKNQIGHKFNSWTDSVTVEPHMKLGYKGIFKHYNL